MPRSTDRRASALAYVLRLCSVYQANLQAGAEFSHVLDRARLASRPDHFQRPFPPTFVVSLIAALTTGGYPTGSSADAAALANTAIAADDATADVEGGSTSSAVADGAYSTAAIERGMLVNAWVFGNDGQAALDPNSILNGGDFVDFVGVFGNMLSANITGHDFVFDIEPGGLTTAADVAASPSVSVSAGEN